ncbi:nucleoside-diphosphate-sugar epimerase [Weissella minor]|uniref:Nucleoside-diphosphate-sugar epimerase n=2 Tax=Weissella minor TaxID=1620 RepID=A0A0R2JIK1_9LACO|nr:nucleoside-diphosphate-sugar epimerase [Weissella minor]
MMVVCEALAFYVKEEFVMTKKILIVGASGRVGRELMDILAQDAHYEVFGTSSHVSDNQHFIQLDLHADFETIRAALVGFDIVYFTAGSRGKDLLQVDLNGNVKVAMAAEQVGVERFVQLSSGSALDQTKWQEAHFASLQDYNVARYFADQWVLQSTLPYTILQAGSLLEAEPTGKVVLTPVNQTGKLLVSEKTAAKGNTIPDVAQVLAELINYPRTAGTIIQMKNGDAAIDTALAEI